MIRFRAFEIVDAVMTSGSIGHAAKSLGLSQPAITKAISAIEADIGGKLFIRTAAGMEPTLSAHVLMQRWVRIRNDLSDMHSEIDHLRSAGDQLLRVATGCLARASVETVLGRLVGQFPDLRVTLQHLGWVAVTAAVRDGLVDIGVAEISDAERDPGLTIECLREVVCNFVCRADHPVLGCDPLQLENLLAYPIASSRIPARIAAHFPDTISRYGLERLMTGDVQPQFEADTLSAIRQICLSSDAIAILPEEGTLGTDGSVPLACIFQPAPDWLTMRIGVISRLDISRTSALSEFMRKIRELER